MMTIVLYLQHINPNSKGVFEMGVYSMRKSYNTKGNMGMIDVTDDFQKAVDDARAKLGVKDGIITGFTTGGVAALTTLEFEPGLVYTDLKKALDVFSPYLDENGRVIHYRHHAPKPEE